MARNSFISFALLTIVAASKMGAGGTAEVNKDSFPDIPM